MGAFTFLRRYTQFDDFNDYGKCYEPLRKLTGIADRYKTHILIIHHKNKGSGTDANSILGSTAFQGAVETMMLISRDQNDDSTFFTRGRNGLDMKALSLTFKDGKISSVISADEKNSQRIKEKVLKALETSEWIEGRHLDEMTISKKSAFLKALADLEKEGLIEKRGEGLRGRPYEFRSRIKNKGKE